MSEKQDTSGAAAPARTAGITVAPPVQYIHHLKFPVADLDRSVTWYEQVFGAEQYVEPTQAGVHVGDR